MGARSREKSKKKYSAPRLFEYGSVQAMTKNQMTGSLTDDKSMKMMAMMN